MALLPPTRRAAALLLASLLGSIAWGAPDADEASRHFRSLDVFELEFASDPRISPDGRRVAYVRTSMNIMTDRRRANLWIVDVDGSNHRPLVSGPTDARSPRWSPDGGRLAYVSTAGAEGTPQLFVRWTDSGQTALLTNLQESPDSLAWSPDGAWIAFAMSVPEQREPLAKPPPMPEGAHWAPVVRVIDSLIYRTDDQGFLEAAHSHIFVVPAEGGSPRQLTSGSFEHRGPLSWDPDGAHILFSANRAEDWEYDPLESEVFSVSLADGSLRQLTDRDGPDRAPRVSPDGRQIAYLGFEDHRQGYQLTHLYVMDRDGSNSRRLASALDRSVASPRWAENGRGIYFLYDDRGTRKLGLVTLGGRIRSVASDIGGTSLGRPYTSGSYTVAANGRVALTASAPQRPADIAVTAGRKAPQRLTHLNDDLLGHKRLGAVSERGWKSSHDGRAIQGWVVTPPDFDATAKYPLILEIHGGPFAAYGPSFAVEPQLYAAAGYVVLYANPRGSTSYGETFGNLIHHAYPGHDYDDLMSGVDALLAEGHVDERELFVTGGSGGGVLTAWIVGQTDRFRAAAVAKPVINWTSFSLTADFYNFFHRYWFPDVPWEIPEHYWQRSPLSRVGHVTTPTLLVSGEADHRTPISEAEQFYQALKLRKIDTAMVRFPEAHHGIAARPSNLIAKVDNILAWFARYRREPEPAEPAAARPE